MKSGSQRAAVDNLVGGVSYALELVAGIRLAIPLGRKDAGTPMPSADPTSLSDSAVADMSATLATVAAFYRGNGFSSRIATKSAVLDTRCQSQLDDCIAQVSAIPMPFVQSVSTQTAKVQSAYDACKVLKATWNTDATSALGATLKPTDNDGD
jgi:predicted lipoprotein